MSIQAMTWALALPLSVSEKMTLVAIGNYADERGRCWPSVPRIASDSSQSDSTVQRRLRSLESIGVLTKHRRLGPDGRRISDEIRLNLAVRPDDIISRIATEPDDDQADETAPAVAPDEPQDAGGRCQIDTGGPVSNCDRAGVTGDGGPGSLLTPAIDEPSVEPLTPQTPLAKNPENSASARLDHFTKVYPSPLFNPSRVGQLLVALTEAEFAAALRAARGYAEFLRKNPRRMARDALRFLRDQSAWPQLAELAPPERPAMVWLAAGSDAYRAACVRAAIVRQTGEAEHFRPLGRGDDPRGCGCEVRAGFPRGAEVGLSRFAADDGAVNTASWVVIEARSAQFFAWSERIRAWTGRHAESVIVMLDGYATLRMPDGRTFESRRRMNGLRVPTEWPPAYGDGERHHDPPPGEALMTDDDLREAARGIG